MLSETQKQFAQKYIQQRKKLKTAGPIIAASVIAIYIGRTQIQNYQPTINTTNPIQTQIIKNALDNFLKPSDATDTQLHIIQGPRNIQDNTIQSNNNLITRAGRILPRNSAIIDTRTLKNKDFFQGNYDIDILRVQINSLLNPGTNPITNRHNNNSLQKISLIENFDLQCTQKTIHSPLCNRNIVRFLDIFYTFDLQNNSQELEDISKKLKKKHHKETYCHQLRRHIQYNQLFGPQRNNTLSICNNHIRQQFTQAQQFFSINNEFINNNFTTTVYDNPDLNAYKLLSLAQIITQDLQNNNPNTRRIEAYINQIQATLRRPILEPIYRDVHYRIINHHLIPGLSDQQNRATNTNQIRTQLLALNRENILLQHSGLQAMLTNKELIQRIQETTIQTNTPNPENIIQSLSTLPYIHIEESIIQQDTIYLAGELHIVDTLNKTSRTPFAATGSIQLNRLIITSINLPDYPLFSNILNTFIQSRNTTLPSVYSYINENIALYQNQAHQDICRELEEIPTFTTNICNPGLIQGQLEQNNRRIEFKINIENNTIQSIQTSDQTRTQFLQETYEGRISDSIRIAALIKEIIITQPETASDQTINNEDIIQVANMFQSFFKTQAKDIAYIQDIYYIEFSIDSITFVIAYNIQTNTLGPLFFKDVLVNNRPLRTNKRNFDPVTENTQNIQRFINNPLNFIQEIDPFTYEIYLQFK